MNLFDLHTEAKSRGWASTEGTLDDVLDSARGFGWREISLRSGDPVVSTLRPRSKDEAHPNSLSSRYGLGAQPLHTDGAHLAKPPDIIVMTNAEASQTSTRLFRATASGASPLQVPFRALRSGMFLVDNNRDSFFTPAMIGTRIRFDPGCMSPCDQRARQGVDFFQAAIAHVVEHEWSVPGTVLLIDNRTTVHARAEVADGDSRRELHRVAFRISQ